MPLAQNRRALALLPPRAEESPDLTTLVRTAPRLEDDPEQITFPRSEEQIRSLGSLGALPLIVLRQGKPAHFPPEVPDDFATYNKERYHACTLSSRPN